MYNTNKNERDERTKPMNSTFPSQHINKIHKQHLNLP